MHQDASLALRSPPHSARLSRLHRTLFAVDDVESWPDPPTHQRLSINNRQARHPPPPISRKIRTSVQNNGFRALRLQLFLYRHFKYFRAGVWVDRGDRCGDRQLDVVSRARTGLP